MAGDALTLRIAHALQQEFAARPDDLPKFNLLVDMDCPRTKNNNIDSITPSAICIEVGPLAHGTLNNLALLHGTRIAVQETLKCIDAFNARAPSGDAINNAGKDVIVSGFTLWKPVYFPKQEGSLTITAALHLRESETTLSRWRRAILCLSTCKMEKSWARTKRTNQRIHALLEKRLILVPESPCGYARRRIFWCTDNTVVEM